MNLPDTKRAARTVAFSMFLWAVAAADAPRRPQPPEAAPAPPKVSKAAVDSAAPCAPLSGDVIPAEKILVDLRDGKAVILQGKTIEGNLDADSVWPATDGRKVSLRVIRGTLKLDSCRVMGRVAFRHCVFMQDFMLPCTEIRGDLDLTDSEIRGAIMAERARVVSDVRLVNTTVDGNLSFKGTTVGGDLDLSGGRLHRVSLRESELLASVTADHTILQTLDLSSAKVAVSMRLSDVLAIESLTARETAFGHDLFLSSVRVAGSIEMSWASVGAEVSLSNVSVEEDLILPRAFEGSAILSDIGVGRNLVLADGLLNDVTIQRLQVRGSSRLDGGRFSGRLVIAESDFGKAFRASQTVFSGDCEFRNVRFPGEDPMAGALFAHAPTLIETKLPREPTVQSDKVEQHETDQPSDDPDADTTDDENP